MGTGVRRVTQARGIVGGFAINEGGVMGVLGRDVKEVH